MIRRLGLLVLLLLAPALAQPQYDLEVKSALGDVCHFDRPVPLVATLRAAAGGNQPATVVVSDNDDPATYSSEAGLTLSEGAAHRVTLMMPNGVYGMQTRAVVAGKPGLWQSVNLSPVAYNDRLILVVAPVGTECNYLSGFKSLLADPKSGEVRIGRPPIVEALPGYWPALTGPDLIVVYDLSRLGLKPSQETALYDYARAGGGLVLVGNGDPVEYSGARRARLGLDRPAHKLPQTEVLMRSAGAGHIFEVPKPVIDLNLLGPAATEELWKSIVAAHGQPPLVQVRANDQTTLHTPPELPMPNAWAISWYLVAFVLLVGPINYGWLRRRDKMLWLVVTVPAISVLFSGGAYLGNSWGRPGHPIVRELSLAWLPDPHTLILNGTTMLFSPQRRDYQIDIPADSWVRVVDSSGRNPYRLVWDGPAPILKDLRIEMWSSRYLRHLTVRDFAPKLEARLSQNTLKLVNDSDLKFTRGFLVKGPDGARVDLTGGATQEVSWDHPASGAELRELSPDQLDAQDADALLQQAQTLLGEAPGLLVATDGLGIDLKVESPGLTHHRLTLLLIPVTP